MLADSYSFRTIYNEDDNEFVGYCAEFPDLAAPALNEEDALNGIEALVANALENMQANGEAIPMPSAMMAEAEDLAAEEAPEDDGCVIDVEARVKEK